MRARSYILVAAGAWLGLAAACIALSVFADPYGLFGTRPIPGLTALKPRIYQESGMAKTYQLERARPKTLLIGNSRVQNGFDPSSSVFPARSKPVYNAGMAGHDLFTSLRLLQEADAAAPVRTVILCVDFTDFLKPPTPPGWLPPMSDEERRLLVDRAGRPNAARATQLWRDRYSATLTISALYDDIATLFDQRPGSSITMSAGGFNPLNEYGFYVRQVGYYGLFAQKTAQYRAQFKKYVHPDFRRPERIANFRYLAGIMRLARERHQRLILFIPPYHAQFLDIVREAGFSKDFEEWKRLLAAMAANGGAGLVDFSGYNAYSTEPVPTKHDRKSRMRWYWEAGHYKSALGDIMLKQLIGGGSGFGRTLVSAPRAQGEAVASKRPPMARVAEKAPAAAN